MLLSGNKFALSFRMLGSFYATEAAPKKLQDFSELISVLMQV